MKRWNTRLLATAIGLTGLMGALPAAQAQTEKAKVFLSMSYTGNEWQSQASNMIKAMAAHPSMANKIELQVQVAGTNAQRQIQQINAMVQAGAKAIIIYPISPTALNQVVRNACAQGVVIFAYDAEITEPCAHNVAVNQVQAGAIMAQWLVDQLNGKGNVVMVTGVPGTPTYIQRTKAIREVFAKYPDIRVVGEVNGMWSHAVARTELSKLLATRSWDAIDGLIMEVGCYTANAMQLEAGRKPGELIPCVGETSNGGRIQMLPVGTQVEGAQGPYRPLGAPRLSYASPPYSGALALKLAVQVLEGKTVPRWVVLPHAPVDNSNIKLCQEGTWAEMKSGCNVFKPSVIQNPIWQTAIFSEDLPEIGMNAALSGQPEP